MSAQAQPGHSTAEATPPFPPPSSTLESATCGANCSNTCPACCQTTPARPSSSRPHSASTGGITDNALLVDRPRRADVFTNFSPSIQVAGDTARLKVNLNYAPVATVYAKTPSQTRFDQFGDAVALATIVPDAVFLDLRGSVTQQSRTGGYGQASTQTLNQNDQLQSIALSVTPYVQHRFSGWGTGRVGYSLARTIQDSRNNQGALSSNQAIALNNNGFGFTGNLTTQRERASFVTGENLGRVNDIVIAEAVQYSGGESYLRDSHI